MAGNLTGRKARLVMADTRALEEQVERVNPVAPSKGRGKKLLGAVALGSAKAEGRDASRHVKGAGATPSMGLSQFRGGAAPLTEEAFAMMDLMPSGEYDGSGKHSLLDHLEHPTKGFGRKGGAETGAYHGEGLSGGGHIVGAGAGARQTKPKRVISADDPRRRRAQLVGKVMKERGCSLAEASKIVKAEGMEY